MLESQQQRLDQLRDLGRRVESLIRELLESHHVRFHYVNHRVKKVPSAERKVALQPDRYADIFDLHDLLGFRIVTYFPDEVDAVAKILAPELDIDTSLSTDRRQSLAADQFGYVSLHYVACLSGRRRELPEYRTFGTQRFEIQMRSILQHTWAEIEHDLGYKVTEAIPRDTRRRLSRLAGLLELADEEFVSIREDISRYVASLPTEIAIRAHQLGIDRESLEKLASTNALVKDLDRELAVSLGGQLRPRDDYAHIVRRLKLVGFSDIGDLLDRLTEKSDLLRAFSRQWLTGRRHSTGASAGISFLYLFYVTLAERANKDLNFITKTLAVSFIGADDDDRRHIARNLVEIYASIHLD